MAEAERTLREGFTTGTTAAAAAATAVRVLLGAECPDRPDVPLPPGGRLAVPVARCGPADPPDAADLSAPATGATGASGVDSTDAAADSPEDVLFPPDAPWAAAEVVKDGGDDPDATHGAVIRARVRLAPGGPGGGVVVRGGAGVGRATLPGLPVAVGRPAINPAPLAQIVAAVREVFAAHGFRGAAEVVVEVDDGAAIARKTMNPRLGIVGGISILGTRGTVKPFSHEAWRATVRQGLDVALAAGCRGVGLSTGRRSERLLMDRRPAWPETAFAQMADFFAFSLSEAAARGFGEIAVSCFFGKLVKMAQGCEYTHAHAADIDFAALAAHFAAAGACGAAVAEVAGANTARQALQIALGPGMTGGAGAAGGDAGADAPTGASNPAFARLMEILARRALAAARGFAGPGPELSLHVFDFDGTPLYGG
jgi:cobalt-precorrin-5B (C1)-methyltransferase